MPVTEQDTRRRQILPDDTARVRQSDPITSHEAADSNDTAASRTFVMLMAHEHGPMTDHQLEVRAGEVHCFWSPSRLRTARHELMQPEYGALLEWTDDRGPSATRLEGAQVWRVR